MKKLICIILVICSVFILFPSCGNTDEENNTHLQSDNFEGPSQNTLKLAYSKSDSLNPFVCESEINTQISRLVFDGLFKLDSSYEPQPEIAMSASKGLNSITVTLNQVKFSDGSDLTVRDVMNSFEQARSSSIYEYRLSNFVSVQKASENSLVFNLETPDPYAVSCLDFPVIKSGSNEDMPIGSGRYSYMQNGENLYLVVNSYKTSFNPIFRTINLESVHETESSSNSLVIGNTSFYYNDLSEGVYDRLNARNVDMGINNFVYLGFNEADSFFSVPQVRRAVSLAVDKEKIVSTAYQSHARAANIVFNPDFYAVNDLVTDSGTNLELAKELLYESGIEPATREISLMYNFENGFKAETAQIIKENLEELGFYVRLKPYTESEFMYDLSVGAFDLYIGEIKLSYNMNLNPVLSADSNYGLSEENETILKYSEFLRDECGIMDFINVFDSDMPLVPLVYRNAVLSYTKAMQSEFGACDSDVFYDIETWSLK